jgi:hypothetical protein
MYDNELKPIRYLDGVAPQILAERNFGSRLFLGV